MRVPLFSRNGQSLIEILIAVAIGAVLITAAASIIVPSLRIRTQTTQVRTGTVLARELLENVRVWSEGDWHNLLNLTTSSAAHYHLNTSSSPFTALSGNESIIVGTSTYVRDFYVDDVYRDSGDLITGSGGSYDPSTKRVTVEYSWLQNPTSTLIEYLTRNRANAFSQTDWSGGSGQTGPVTSTVSGFASSTSVDYASTTGSITVPL